jgi:hypothetical protein
MLVVYTFVFGVVFRARWGLGDDASTAKFAVVLFSGLITYNLFSECVNRAPRLILENVNYVKKVVFPLEIMPWIAMGQCRRSYRVQRGCTRRRPMDCDFTTLSMASVCTADDGDMLVSCRNGCVYA